MRKFLKAKNIVAYSGFIILVILVILQVVMSTNPVMRTSNLVSETSLCVVNDTGKIAYGTKTDGVLVYDGDTREEIGQFLTGNPQREIILLQEDGEEFLFATGDRKIYTITKDDNILSDSENSGMPIVYNSAYNPDQLIVSTDCVAIYSYKNALKSSVQVYNKHQEEIKYKLDFDCKLAGIAFDEESNLFAITAQGKAFRYDGTGNLVEQKNLNYVPELRCVAFYEGYIYVANQNKTVSKLDLNYNIEKIFSVSDNVTRMCVGDGKIALIGNTGIEFLNENKSCGIYSLTGVHSIQIQNDVIYVLQQNKLVELNLKELEQNLVTKIPLIIIKVALAVVIIFEVISLLNLIPSVSAFLKKQSVAASFVLKRDYKSYLLILPTMILLGIFCYYTAFSGFAYAFMDYKPGIKSQWIGLANFKAVFQNTIFWGSMGNMVLFLVADLIKAIVPAIIFAELIFAVRNKHLQYWMRVLLFIPGILPGVSVMLIWANGILGNNGLINQILRELNLSSWARPWLSDEATVKPAIIFVGFPYVGSYLLFFGALLGIPKDFHAAAELEGCGWIRRIICIDIPLVFPQIKYVFVMTFIASIQNFAGIYLLTEGGPGTSTYTPMLEMYYTMSKFQDYGQAAAMGIILFFIIFGATLVNMRMKTASD